MTTDQPTPSQRAGLRDEIVKALGQIKTVPPVAHRREQADHVLAVLYQAWPWLRAEAEGARLHDPVSSAVAQSAPADRAAAVASCPGRELDPNPCRCPCYGCKHHCSAHNPDEVPDGESPPAEAALREQLRRTLAEADGFGYEGLEPHDYQRHVDAVLPLLPASVEEHRLALSDALGLGTGAPWDAIHDRVTELALPPLSQDPVARRLGLVAEHRAAVLHEVADAAVTAQIPFVSATGRECFATWLRSLAAAAPTSVGQAAHTTRSAEDHLARVHEWVTSDVVTARSEFGNGYREAQRDIRDLLAGRRMADETQPAEEGEAHPPTHTWKVESPRRGKWASWGATHDERVWAATGYDDVIEVAPQRPFRLVRATTTYAVEAEHQPTAGPAVGAQQPKEADGERVVAYSSPGGFYLYCTRHRDELSPYWPPVLSEDLPDGGLCAKCGVDVLIPQQPTEA